MQGRLLPKYKGRYQAHPKNNWPDEFFAAKRLDLELIEFILDYEDAEENPLLSPYGAQEIRLAIARNGRVTIMTVCADYFMEAPLHARDPAVAASSAKVLSRLLARASELGVTDVLIPCVDQSSVSEPDIQKRLIDALQATVPEAEKLGVSLCLETDLDPDAFAKLLDRLPSKRVTVNYDIGNSASLGYDPKAEFAAYGKRISDIHIKDRLRGGGSVPLGEGNADIPLVFRLMEDVGYSGPLIMQAFRDDEGVEIFQRQLEWLQDMYGPEADGCGHHHHHHHR
jgi:hexulose-6-phosphate isomerase